MRKLTPREYDFLMMMRNGCENAEMARIASVSIHTVKAHVSSILKKLGARNRTSAIYLAVKSGLIE